MKKKQLMIAVAVVASMALGAFGTAFAAQDSECDRQCLVNVMQQ